MQDKNILTVSGMVNVIEKSHDFHGEQFYRIMLDVIRLSGNLDTIPIVVSEKLLFNNEITPGMFITIEGRVRTKNQKEAAAKSRLLVFGYASDVKQITEEELIVTEIKNQIMIEGYLCKVPSHRRTNTGRIITDLLIACNRQYSKSDYIPCITWGINAKMAKNLRVGDKIRFTGRFQSREYHRKNDDIGIVSTAYEISISHIEIINNEIEVSADPAIDEAAAMAQYLHTKKGIVFKEAI